MNTSVTAQMVKRKAGLTTSQMAKLLHVSDKTVQSWLYGYAEPNQLHQDVLREMYRQAVEDEQRFKKRVQAGLKLVATMGAIGFLIKLLEEIPTDDK